MEGKDIMISVMWLGGWKKTDRLTGNTMGEYFEGDIEGLLQLIFIIIYQPLALFPENDTGEQRPDNVGYRIRPAGQKGIAGGRVFKNVGQNLK